MTRALRALAVGAVALVTLVGLAPMAHAEESIDDYVVDARVTADGLLEVTETIQYDFDVEERHGIFRDLPLYSELPDGTRWQHPTTVGSVTMDGNQVPYELSDDGTYLNVRIGDGDVLITGPHVYEISYVVEGALRTLTNADIAEGNPYGLTAGDVELYWDFVGTGWEVSIGRVMVDVVGPGPILATECFTGTEGSTEECTDNVIDDRAIFRRLILFPYEGLTGVVAFPGSAFTTPPVQEITTPPVSESPGTILLIGGPLALLALILPAILTLVFRRRLQGARVHRGPVRFSPPGDLRPAEIAVGMDGDLEPRAVVATLLDFVARRYITLSSDPGGLLSKGSIHLTWKGEGTDTLRPWEDRMLAAIFEGRTEATLSGYDAGFAKAVSEVEETLSKEAIRASRLDPEAKSSRQKVGCSAMIAFAVAFISVFVGAATENMLILLGLIPVAVCLGIGLLIATLLVPQRETVESAKFESEVEGFKRFLDTDPGEARRELVQRMGLPAHAVFATYLPYAVLFDLEGSWAGAFPDLTQEQLYSTGLLAANTVALSSLLSNASGTVRSASTAPSSSGGSGFSGGGSGGGGGGGGGGSW